MPAANPLLEPHPLPPFARIEPGHVAPALAELLAANRAALAELAAAPPRWEAVLGRVEELEDRLAQAWSPVAHLAAVRDEPALRAAYDAALPELSAWATELGQDRGLFEACQRLAARDGLDPVRRKVLEDWLRDFRLAGVHLPDGPKARWRAIQAELATLEAQVEHNVLDSMAAWRRDLPDAAALRGLPADAVARAVARAAAEDRAGATLELDGPTYQAVLTFAEDRALRAALWEAWATRASDRGPLAGRFDNLPLLPRILALRHEAARLVGYPDHATLSLATKTAATPERARAFLEDLVARVRPQALAEREELARFAREQLGLATLEPWDAAFAAEKLRAARFGLREEELRPYFPAARVLAGLFATLDQLYGIRFERLAERDAWDPAVELYAVRDARGALRGYLFVDLYARHGKRGGAWMDECRVRRRTATGLQLPAAYLVCNLPPPGDAHPSLLTHDDVLTLFHEAGHCLHHLLTQVEVADASGINGVEWDAVELPSQFHERFAWDPRVLALCSAHVDDGQPLPAALVDKLRAARTFHAALALMRQLELALYDLDLHRAPPPDPLAALAALRARIAVAPRPDWERMPASFTHVFAGGYAAGYYGYLWAEVMASDAFAAFEERGVLDPATGARFEAEVLARGGGRPALASFVAFRGREPTLDAFLRHHGVRGGEP
jgi:oligopeptidase A